MDTDNAASTSSSKRYWLCARCGGRNERAKIKCRTEGCAGRRRKKPRPRHAEVLRGDTYPAFEQFNELVHGPAHPGEWTADCCGVCGRPPRPGRRMDRDHDHLTGEIRGLACPGNNRCNSLMAKWVTAPVARAIALAKQEAREPDAEQWLRISAYLGRCEAFRASQGLTA